MVETFEIIDEVGPYNDWETSRALFLGWLWGGGYPLSPVQKFKGGDAFTKVLAGDKTIGNARAVLLAQALESGMEATFAKEPYEFTYDDSGPAPGCPWRKFHTPRGIYNDFSSVPTNGKLGHVNMADAYLGSYSAKAQIGSVDKEKDAVRNQFSVKNLSDWNSPR
ncbi:hypothetical protein [Streptomyces sp. cmx-4-9]|uniref:hypothetical protein n=1 Tax=Streptomyces sp. cmx-4-9 TaxID=2790941 RepID=UPI00397EB06F